MEELHHWKIQRQLPSKQFVDVMETESSDRPPLGLLQELAGDESATFRLVPHAVDCTACAIEPAIVQVRPPARPTRPDRDREAEDRVLKALSGIAGTMDGIAARVAALEQRGPDPLAPAPPPSAIPSDLTARLLERALQPPANPLADAIAAVAPLLAPIVAKSVERLLAPPPPPAPPAKPSAAEQLADIYMARELKRTLREFAEDGNEDKDDDDLSSMASTLTEVARMFRPGSDPAPAAGALPAPEAGDAGALAARIADPATLQQVILADPSRVLGSLEQVARAHPTLGMEVSRVVRKAAGEGRKNDGSANP